MRRRCVSGRWRRATAVGALLASMAALAGCGAWPQGDRPSGSAADAGPAPSPGLVAVGGSRLMYGWCEGSGSPAVVLVSGARTAGDMWSAVRAAPEAAAQASADSVMGRTADTTTVCAYDRPGTERIDRSVAPSTLVVQPTTAQAGVSDLRAWLTAAGVPPPYVLVGHSWGGAIATLYAGTYPADVAGLVLVDPASRELQQTLTPAQWDTFVALTRRVADGTGAEAPDYVHSIDAVGAARPAASTPVVVLTSDRPFDFGNFGAAAEGTWAAWVAAQLRLAERLGGRQVTRTDSGHMIPLDNPALVAAEIRSVLDAVRGGGSPSFGSAGGMR